MLLQDVVIGFPLFRGKFFRWDLGISTKGWGELSRFLLFGRDSSLFCG
jgi:hypothetical protein